MELLNSLIYMLGEMSPYILLGFLIAGIMHAFIPRRQMARHLSGSGWKSVVKAAAIGVPLPLCSCGVLPTAIAMHRNGASKAATSSFLIATPQTGVDSIAATWSLLGPAFAIVRPIAALVTAMFGGVAVGTAEKKLHTSTIECDSVADENISGFKAKCIAALRYGFIDLVGSIGSWLVVGLIIAALITVYVPADFFASLSQKPLLSMLAVLAVAIPMYVCATGSIPIALSLMLKGLSPGTALVLLMAGPAANFASFTLISKEMGRKAAVIYLLSIVVGALIFGLAIDYLMPATWFPSTHRGDACSHHDAAGIFTMTCSGILVILLILSLIRRIHHNKHIYTDMTQNYIIKGMNCPHCQATVAKAISNVSGVTAVDVNLSSGVATVEGNHSAEAVVDAVRKAGFEVSK